jgi:hypothetical protein
MGPAHDPKLETCHKPFLCISKMDIERTITTMLEDFSKNLLTTPENSAEIIRDMKWKMLDLCTVAYGTMDIYDALLAPLPVEQNHHHK